MTTRRRQFIAAVGALGILPWRVAQATPAEAAEAIRAAVGSALVKNDKVSVQIPPLVENGNLVPLKVSVDSPMTADDYVKAIHVIAEGNPLPNVISFFLGPRAGRAEVSTRIRMAESQRIWVVAQTSTGLCWQGSAESLVTLSACTEMI